MGSSSTNIPAPDPRLIEAQIKSMGVQDQAASSILELAKQQADANASLLPIQKESLQFGLDASKRASELSESDRFGRSDRRRSSLRLRRRVHRQHVSWRHQCRQRRGVTCASLARELGEG